MPDFTEWPPTTVRGAVTVARNALAGAGNASFPAEEDVELARRSLEHAVSLLDASDREMGAFLEAEPYRLVLDPLPQRRPTREPPADGGAKLLV
jgi:hypothetical protein